MAINAKELAKLLGLSEAAVSMALNGKPGVSTHTRKKVMEAARAHGYDFSKQAGTKVYELKGTICFVIYRKSGAVVADTPFFSSLTEGIGSGCKQAGYQLNIHYLYEDENLAEQIRLLNGAGYAGVILLATEMTLQSLQPFSGLKTPVLLLDSYFSSLPYDSVLINNVQGAFTATSYLIAKCKAQPGYLHSSYSINNFEDRADGFYKAIRTSGMSTAKSVVHRLPPSQEGAYADMKALLAAGEEPAACYFADNDLIAAGAIAAFKEAGYRVPQDISVVGFDNLPMFECMDPPLTTVHVPKQYMGEVAAGRMVQLVEEKNHQPLKIEVNTSLIKRKSVCAAQ